MTHWPNDIGRCQEQGEAATEVGADDGPTRGFGAAVSAFVLVMLALLVALLSFHLLIRMSV